MKKKFVIFYRNWKYLAKFRGGAKQVDNMRQARKFESPEEAYEWLGSVISGYSSEDYLVVEAV